MRKNTKAVAPPTNKALALSWGDPAGIGPEVILKSFLSLPKRIRNRITVFGDISYFRALDRRLRTDVSIIDSSGAKPGGDHLKVEHVVSVKFSPNDFGKVDKRMGRAAMISVEKAMDAVLEGRFGALVTAPINKKSVNRAGYHVAGHTEFLARRLGGAEVAMMLSSEKLKVVVATTHLALSDVPGRLTVKKLTRLIKLVNVSLEGLARFRRA